jgi:YHS domain-containing protein
LLPTAPDRPANRTIEDGPIRRLRSRLLLIYRRSYGTRLMLRMLVIFWGVMSAAGLITEGIFDVAGLIPTTRPTQVAPAHFSWNYTTYLNIVFLVLFAALYWAYRNRDRLGGGAGYALDPVCGMQVETANAPASGVLHRSRFYFCSDHCRGRFETNPERFAARSGPPEGGGVPPAGLPAPHGR